MPGSITKIRGSKNFLTQLSFLYVRRAWLFLAENLTSQKTIFIINIITTRNNTVMMPPAFMKSTTR